MQSFSRSFDSSTGAGVRNTWIETIHSVFGDADIQIPSSETFVGRIRSSRLGHVKINRVECSSEDAARTRRHLASGDSCFYAMSFVMKGSLVLEQRGRTCTAGPGTFVLFDLQSPYRHRHSTWADVLSIKIPGAMLNARLQDVHRHIGQIGRADHGIGRVTRDALVSLADETTAIPEATARACSVKMIDLISIVLEAGADGVPVVDSAVRSVLRRRITDFIKANMANPRLDAPSIAAANGISVRYLHKIFQDSGQTVCEVLRTLRLEKCFDGLLRADPGISIKSIAFGAGFSSQAHFSTDFKRKYHLTPTALLKSSQCG